MHGVPGLPAGPGPGFVAPGRAGQEAGATQKQVFEKMAAALGKDAAAIEKAFQEATAELGKDRRTEQINKALEKLVKDGVITEQEAAELRAWVEKAPGFLLDGSALPFPGPRSFTGPRDGMPDGMPRMLPRPPGREGFRGVPRGDVPRGFRNFRGPDGLLEPGTGPEWQSPATPPAMKGA